MSCNTVHAIFSALCVNNNPKHAAHSVVKFKAF